VVRLGVICVNAHLGGPMQQLNILVAGMDYEPNQVTRAVSSYGVKAYHVNGDVGKSFPSFVKPLSYAHQ